MTSPRLRTLALGVLAAAVALAALVGGLAWWAAATQRGATWSFERLAALTPGQLTAGRLEGTLWGPLEIHSLRYASDQIEITAERVSLDWRPRALMERRLDVRRLEARGVRVRLAAPEAAPETTPAMERLPDIELPVTVRLDRARILDLTIAGPEEGEPVSIDEILLETVAMDDSLEVGRLHVRAPMADLEARGGLRPRGTYPLEIDVEWTVRPPEVAALSGRGRLSGALEDLTVVQTLEAPFNATLETRLRGFPSEGRFEGTFETADLSPRSLNPEWPAGRSSGRLAARGGIEDFSCEGRVSTDFEATGPLDADFRLSRAGEAWRIERLLVTVPKSRASLVLRGEMSPSGLGVTGEWADWVWPPRGDTLVSSPRGTLRVEGSLARYGFDLGASLGTRDFAPERWRAAGQGDTTHMRIESVRGRFLGGTISGEGRVSWSPEVAWVASARVEGLDPGRLWPEWAGEIAIGARSAGRLRPSGPFAEVEVDRVEGQLRRRPIEGAGTVALRGWRRTSSRLDFEWGSARLAVRGEAGDSLDLAAVLDAPTLDGLVPGTSGTLRARAEIRGTPRVPLIRASLRGDSLGMGGYRADSVGVEADIDLTRDGKLDVGLEALGVDLGARRVERLAIASRGPPSGHRLEVEVGSGRDSLALELAGELEGRNWRGEIRTLDLATELAGKWSLVRPAPLSVTGAAVELGEVCWGSTTGRVCAEAGWDAQGPWRLDATVDQVPVALMAPWLPPELGLTGVIDGQVSARATERWPALDVTLAPGPGEIRYPTGGGKRAAVAYERGTIRIRTDEQGLTGRLSVRVPSVGSIEAELDLPGYGEPEPPLPEQPLSGRVRVHMDDLALLQGFFPALHRPRGRLDADLTLEGTSAEPRIRGSARLAEGSADILATGVELREASLGLEGEGTTVNLAASVRSGPGRLSVEGSIDLGSREPKVDLAISGRRFQAANTREAQVLVDPDLRVRAEGARMEISGQVVVPQAKIALREVSETAAGVSGDVVYEGPEADSTVRAVGELRARVRVILGDSISFAAQGLEARPTGSILAIEEPGKPTTGTGELELKDGTYKAYGQELTIERGRLFFGGGPIENPGLDVRASRRASDGVVAGFEIHGTLQAPELKIFSDPAMPESDALAYIVLGHPLDKATSGEQNLVTDAATSLGLRGGSLIAGRLARRIGVEEARIESEGAIEDASLLLGTFLSPRIYVNYGIGLMDPVSTFRVRYLLSRKWTLQVKTAQENSADIMYSIEH